jgi:hypothetical protein
MSPHYLVIPINMAREGNEQDASTVKPAWAFRRQALPRI